MRTDLRLNYDELEQIQDRISDYNNALNDVESAVVDLKSFLSEQESEAIDKLKEKMENVKIDIGKKKDTLTDLERILGNYVSDMKSHVDQVGSGQTRVDTWDISANIAQIYAPVSEFYMETARTVRTGFHFSVDLDEEAKKRSEKLTRNYNRLENYRKGSLRRFAVQLMEYVNTMKDIYNNHLKPYEQKDDEYRRRLNNLYDRHTSNEDKMQNFWESFVSIAGSFAKALVVSAVSAFVIALLPTWAIVGIIVVAMVGCAVMANIPEESVPDWLKGVKHTADGLAEEAIEVLHDPTALVEKIGQGLTDTIQTPEGIATLAGTLLGSVAGGYAGTEVKALRADGDILIDSYEKLRKNSEITGQAHHLNQNAVFKEIIPKNEGLAVELKGNIFKDVGSQHYNAHKSLENFWNQYRTKGVFHGNMPTMTEYNSALYDSLRAAGLTKAQAQKAVQSALSQQLEYGLKGDMFVPRIPGRINLRK